MHEGKAKIFLGVAGNFVRATPDSAYTEEAMRKCRLTAHVSTKLNRSHTVTGEYALILPTLGRSDKYFQNGVEQWITVEDSMSDVHRSHGKLPPASPWLLSEVSMHDGSERRAEDFTVVSYPASRGSAAAYYPETNVLVPIDSVADVSNCPTSKAIVVRLEPRQAA